MTWERVFQLGRLSADLVRPKMGRLRTTETKFGLSQLKSVEQSFRRRR